MPIISSDSLNHAVTRLIEKTDFIVAEEIADLKVDQLEKTARAISVQLKALHEIEQHNQHLAQQADNKKYLSYEDLPPPTPEERARFRDRLERLIAKIEIKEPMPDAPPSIGGKPGPHTTRP